ncbi:MAG: hypothetical protein ABR555_12260, partial [Pyrinomonadaceae bacterium]
MKFAKALMKLGRGRAALDPFLTVNFCKMGFSAFVQRTHHLQCGVSQIPDYFFMRSSTAAVITFTPVRSVGSG